MAQEGNTGSALGNAFRNIPLVGGILGGVGDIVSGVGNAALGVASFGHSGTFGRGFGQIGHGIGGTLMGTLDIAGKAWNAPNTAIGITLGLLGVPFGARIHFRHNAIEFENHPFMRWGALTLGNTIHYPPDKDDFGPSAPLYPGSETEVWEHEIQHTYQGQILGPLYLPVHIPSMLWSIIKSGDTHKENPMEGELPWPGF